MFKKKQAGNEGDGEVAPEVGNEATPWILAMRRHEDRTLRLQAQVQNWRMFAFGCLFIAAIAVTGMAWVGSMSKFIPMIFEVDKLGQTVAVKALHGDEAVTDVSRLVYREMFDLIENLRTVTTDRQANNDRLSKGFSRLKGAAEKYVRAELRKAPPNEVGATRYVQVTVRSALKLTGKNWQVDWEEQSYSLAGEKVGPPEYWRGTVRYELNPSPEEKIFRKNPSGFEVAELTWQAVAQQRN